MTNIHSPVAEWIDPNTVTIGRLPYASTIGRPLHHMYNNMVNYRHDPLYTFHGSLANENANPTSGTHYVITHAPGSKNTAARRIGVATIAEPAGASTTVPHLKWYDSLAGTSYQELTGFTSMTSDDLGDDGVKASFANIFQVDRVQDEILYMPPTSNPYYSVCRLVYVHMGIASLSIYHLPRTEIADGDYVHPISAYGEGCPLKAAELGQLIEDIGGGSAHIPLDTEVSVERITRRCLFQSGFPDGMIVEAEALTNIFGGAAEDDGASIALRPRMLGASSVGALPALVVSTAHAGDVVKIKTYSGVKPTAGTVRDTWTWTATGTISTPTLIGPEDGTGTLTCSGTTSRSIAAVYASSADVRDAVVLNTVSIWEGGVVPGTPVYS